MSFVTHLFNRLASLECIPRIALAGLIACGANTAIAAATTYTSDADFERGTLDGVNYEAPNSNQLQLGVEGSTFPAMWIANAGEDSVSRIDTELDCETARYETWFRGAHLGSAFTGPAPSRTAVDGEGNVYVLNRHFDGRPASVIKILADGGIDRNANGVIDTSTDDGDCLIDRNNPTEVIRLVDSNGNGLVDQAELADERVAWIVQVGPNNGLGRALCLDPDAGLWVGLFNREEYYRLDSSTGAVTAGPISVAPINPYGCLVDNNGFLWSADRGDGGNGPGRKIGKLDTASSPPTLVDFYNHGVGTHYSLALADGKVVLAIENAAAYLEFDIESETFASRAATTSRGISTDALDNVYVGRDTVQKRAADGSLIWSTQNPTGFADQRGVIFDGNNGVWVVNKNANSVTKFNATSGSFETILPVGDQPYTYSDATGFAFRNNTNPSGIWRVTTDSAIAGTIWDKVTWNEEAQGEVPNGATLTVEIRAAEDAQALANVPFQAVSNAQQGLGLVGRLLEIRATFFPDPASGASPILSDITIASLPTTTTCDVDDNEVTDVRDIRAIAAARNLPANSNDPRDADGNGQINVNDVRQCVLRCSLPRCAQAVLVPLILGLSETQAELALVDKGLVLGEVRELSNDVVPQGTIFDQTPLADSAVAPGTEVAIVVSSGSSTLELPNVVGQLVADARTVLENARCRHWCNRRTVRRYRTCRPHHCANTYRRNSC